MPSVSSTEILALVLAVIGGLLSSSVLVALIEYRRMRKQNTADVADKISSAWDRFSEESRAGYTDRIDGLLRQAQEQDRRITDLEQSSRDKDKLYAELGERLRSEIRMRLQHEATIDTLKRENEVLRERVSELERKLSEIDSSHQDDAR